MSIEAYLQSIDASLQTIAATLVELNYNNTAGPASTKTTEVERPATSGKGKTTAATKGKPAKEKRVKEEKTEEAEEPEVTLNDVRAALTALQKVVGADGPKNLLKEHGATTLSKLEKESYPLIIAAANKAKEEAEAE
jgi:hypothetical protein